MDVLALGVRVVNLLETGRRESTYKLAALTALLQHCVEHATPGDPEPVAVPVADLADRCIGLYWRQVRPFRGQERLRQTRGGDGRLLPAVQRLRDEADVRGVRTPAALRAAAPDLYRRARRTVAHQLAAMPLAHLQHETRSGSFLYDDSWLHKKVTVVELDAHGWRIELRPGVAAALARLSTLLVPVLEMLWLSEVRRLNAGVFADTDDLAEHLFGTRRADLDVVRSPLLDLQRGRCFYCADPLRAGEAHVDHVLPWSRTGLDALGNLVVADPLCNAAKSDVLPVGRHVRHALDRVPDLVAVAAGTGWPVEAERVRRTASGLIAFAPDGVRLWEAGACTGSSTNARAVRSWRTLTRKWGLAYNCPPWTPTSSRPSATRPAAPSSTSSPTRTARRCSRSAAG